MIVAADFFGFVDGSHLCWSLQISESRATVRADWNPARSGKNSTVVTFGCCRDSVKCSVDAFGRLRSRYATSMEGGMIRSLSIADGNTLRKCTVHGSPSIEESPELVVFDEVWRQVDRLVMTELAKPFGCE